MTSLCHSLRPSTNYGWCSDADQEEKLFLSAVVLNELPYSPQPLDRLCSSSLRCSCLSILTLGLKKAFWGSVLGRTTKAEDTHALLLLKWETSRKDHSCMCKMYRFSCGNYTTPNAIIHRAKESEKDSKRATWWSAGEARKEKSKEKENTEHKNYWPQTYHVISEKQQKT